MLNRSTVNKSFNPYGKETATFQTKAYYVTDIGALVVRHQFEFPFANCTSPMIHLVGTQIFCISFLSSISLGTTVIPSGYANVWGADKVYNRRCANGNKFINFPFSRSLRGLNNLVLSTDSQLSIRPSLGIREEGRGGEGTFAVSPFRSLLLQILILGWSTVSQSPYGGQSTCLELRSPSNATPQFLVRY